MGTASTAGPKGGPFQLIVDGINSPADFGLDTKRNLLIVPHLKGNVVSLHSLD